MRLFICVLTAALLRVSAPCEVLEQLTFEKRSAIAKLIPGEENARAASPFLNASSQPVRIVQLKPSCGCVSAVSSKPVFEPGERGTIDVTISRKNRVGLIRETVAILTSASQVPETLALEVEFPRHVTTSVAALAWNAPGDVAEKPVALEGDRPFTIERVNCSSDVFKFRIEEIRARLQYRLWITPDPGVRGNGLVTIAVKFEDGKGELCGVFVSQSSPAK